ncbi:TetR/AcrR family transcriptional regulator [Microbacterium sp. SLBN-146]|uniref:TetR/AcrR family transcriptional regulator n=1 Tax=Microbacterium sp. SLBN-146 TaxID=2768457 RepID=UPI00116DAB29|nr:TetR/AcrR family transcriptional regulator [Microbacterium sp. SLBN-146]TQJ30011.1 TetR family transcriptional regulator [Microbacterium sp. SLBN-146]
MPRGRSFDPVAVLDAAIDLFWADGYAGVSMQDIADASGIGNGSIYLAFGSKWNLFIEAFRVYCARRVELVRAGVFVTAGSTEDIVSAYFDAIIAACASDPQRRGCLLINSIAELGDDAAVAEIARQTIGKMEAELAGAIVRASDARADSSDVARAAEQAVAMSQSLILGSRLGRPTPDLQMTGRAAARTIARGVLVS